jgi:hypothetical protein
MDERQRRLAQNEALFREVNERIDGLGGPEEGPGGVTQDYLCECANVDCTFRVSLRGGEYEAVRADPRRFVVLPEHYTPEVEVLVQRTDRYWVVEKTGDTGDYVTALDPRSR